MSAILFHPGIWRLPVDTSNNNETADRDKPHRVANIPIYSAAASERSKERYKSVLYFFMDSGRVLSYTNATCFFT